jgi:hypothetical protein
MPISQAVTVGPPAPNRATDDQASFSLKADALAAYLVIIAPELNQFSAQANALQTDVNVREQLSVNSANVATGAANFRGAWSSATAYTVGESVLFNGQIFIALVNNTNVTPVSGATWVLFVDLLLARQHALALSF